MTTKTTNGVTPEAEDGASFVRILFESRLIRRPSDMVAWLKEEVQEFLPHQIMIAAWGAFSRWNVKSEVVSSLPGVRAAPIGRCGIDDLLRSSYAQWIGGGQQPLPLAGAAGP